MPLGNLTSQFFANIYLNKLDHYVKRKLQVNYYIRYVDDFVILHNSRKQLFLWKSEIENFLKQKLKLELHKGKSNIISLHRGIDFVGFRNFYFHKLIRKRNVRKIPTKIDNYHKNRLMKAEMLEVFQGWNAYVKYANTLKLRKQIVRKIYSNA